MEELGITMLTREMRPPHHVDGNSDFVKTLLSVYEEYTGRKGECVSMGGGTYVHDLKKRSGLWSRPSGNGQPDARS